MRAALTFELQKIDKNQAGIILGRHPDSLKLLRKSGFLLETIHFCTERSGVMVYWYQARLVIESMTR